jgi:Na+-driven multidrug efflux pump
VLCQWRPDLLIRAFTNDPQVVEVGAVFLSIISLNFAFSGFAFTCSSLFQGIGNTWPSLISSASRLITFVPVAMYLAAQPGFELRQLWYWSVCTVALQSLTSYVLLKREFRKRLQPAAALAPAVSRSA